MCSLSVPSSQQQLQLQRPLLLLRLLQLVLQRLLLLHMLLLLLCSFTQAAPFSFLLANSADNCSS